MVSRFKALFVIVMLAVLVAFAAPHMEVMAEGAQLMSRGCTYVNQNSDLSLVSYSFFITNDFWADEVITVTDVSATVNDTIYFSISGMVTQKGSIPFSASLTIPADGEYSVYVYPFDGDINGGTISCTPTHQQTPEPLKTPDVPVNVPFVPGDARMNQGDADRAEPVAVYCSANSITIIRVDAVTSAGVDPVSVSAADIDKAGVPADGYITLAKTDWVLLSRLADGSFQVNAWYTDGKPYTISWQDCSAASIVYLEH